MKLYQVLGVPRSGSGLLTQVSDRVFQVCLFHCKVFCTGERQPERQDKLRDMDRWKAFAALIIALDMQMNNLMRPGGILKAMGKRSEWSEGSPFAT